MAINTNTDNFNCGNSKKEEGQHVVFDKEYLRNNSVTASKKMQSKPSQSNMITLLSRNLIDFACSPLLNKNLDEEGRSFYEIVDHHQGLTQKTNIQNFIDF